MDAPYQDVVGMAAGPTRIPRRPEQRPSISLVLPAYNEAATIEQAIREADVALARLTPDYEIIVVDDGSADQTVARAVAVARRRPAVRVLRQERNQGYGAALRRGFQAATKDLVGFTDADCQFDLTELDRLVLLADHYDIVCGYRIDRQDPFRRKVFSGTYNLLVRGLLGTRVRDCDCALKLFRRDVVTSLGLETNGFFFNAELLAKARMAGKSVVEVGVSHRPRAAGQSTVSFGQALPIGTTLLRFAWNQVLFPRAATTESDRSPGWTRPKQIGALAVLAAMSALLLFLNLSYPLIEPDESRYAQIGLETFESGDYLTPTLLGKPYLDKPPLLYWATAASYRVFGANEFAARVPSALAALLTILITYWLGRRLLGVRAAWIGALLLLMCIGFVLSGRFLIMDGLLTLLTTAAILTFYLGYRQPRFRPGWWLAAGVACGLGVLTKGPVAAVFCVPPLVIYHWLCGEDNRLRWYHGLWFAGPALVVSVPWFLLISQVHPEFSGYFLWRHHLVRFFSTFTHAEPWWYYVPALLIGMFPCSMLLPPLGVFLASRAESHRRARSPALGFLLLAAAWIIGFLSLSSCKLPTYALPALPLLCLMVGRMVDSALLNPRREPYFQWVADHLPAQVVAISLLAGLGLGIAGLALGNDHLAGRVADITIVSATATVLLIGLLLVIARRSRPSPTGRHWPQFRSHVLAAWGRIQPALGGTRPHLAWVSATAVTLAVITYGFADFFPRVSALRSVHSRAARLQQTAGRKPLPVIYFGDVHYSVTFHRRGDDVWFFRDRQVDRLKAFLRDHPRVVLVTKHPASELARSLGPTLELVPAGGRGRVYLSRPRHAAAAGHGATLR